MTKVEFETEQMLAQLQRQLSQKLASWTWPSGVEAEEIVVESIEAFWQATDVRNEKIREPIRWLLSTSRRLKLEKSRSVRAYRSKPLSHYGDDPQIKRRPETFGIADSMALSALGFEKKFAITEILMFDRWVTEVARELGVKRSTVNGWICRIPKQLALLPELQAFAAGGES